MENIRYFASETKLHVRYTDVLQDICVFPLSEHKYLTARK